MVGGCLGWADDPAHCFFYHEFQNYKIRAGKSSGIFALRVTTNKCKICYWWVQFLSGICRLSVLRTPEEQYISERLWPQIPANCHRCPWVIEKLDIAQRQFCRQCIMIQDMEVSVPASNDFFDISREFGTGSTPTSFSMIMATPLRTMPNKISS